MEAAGARQELHDFYRNVGGIERPALPRDDGRGVGAKGRRGGGGGGGEVRSNLPVRDREKVIR